MYTIGEKVVQDNIAYTVTAVDESGNILEAAPIAAQKQPKSIPDAQPTRSKEIADVSIKDRAWVSQADPDQQSKEAAWTKRTGKPAKTIDGTVHVLTDNEWQPVEHEASLSDIGGTLKDLGGDVADIAGQIPEIGASIAAAGKTFVAAGGPANPLAYPLAALAGGGTALLGAGARQKSGELTGVPYDEGKSREARKEAAVYGAAGELLPIGVIGAKALKGAVKPGLKAIGEAVTGIDSDVIGKLASKEGTEILAKRGLGDRGAEQHKLLLLDVVKQAKEAPSNAYTSILDTTTAEGQNFLQSPVNVDAAIQDALEDAVGRKLITPAGDLDIVLPSAEGAVKQLGEIIDLAAEANTVDRVLVVRRRIDDMLDKKGAFEEIKGIGDVENVLTTLRRSLESAVEGAANNAGIGEKYVAAKQAYIIRKELADELVKLSGTGSKASSKTRNLDSQAQTQLRTTLKKLEDLEPQLTPQLEELYQRSAAKGLDKVVGANYMDIGRGTAAILGSVAVQDPIMAGPVLLGYVATRPKFAAPGIVRAGKAARKLESIGAKKKQLQIHKAAPNTENAVRSVAGGEIGDDLSMAEIRKAVKGIDDMEGRVIVDPTETSPGVLATSDGGFYINASRFRSAEELREAILDAAITPQAAIRVLSNDMPRISRFVKERYGAKVSKLVKEGVPEDQAILDTISDITDRPGISNAARHWINIVRDTFKNDGVVLSDTDIKYLLGKAAKRELGIGGAGKDIAAARIIGHTKAQTED